MGSHHSKVDPSEFRGISIANPAVPMIIINPNDADVAQVFTLIHEMSHIWLGESGVSNIGLGDVHKTISHEKLENFCNGIAAEFLAPQSKINEFYKNNHM